MKYFARISSQLRPANRLQEYLLRLVQKFDNVLLDDPEELFRMVEQYAQQASRANHRCTPQKAGANRDFKTKEISSIGAGGLFTISLHKVTGTLAPQTAETKPAPALAPLPPPEPEPESQNQPRHAICTSREDDKPSRFVQLGEFAQSIQALLQSGKVWRMYQNGAGQVIAEEYGGNRHPVAI